MFDYPRIAIFYHVECADTVARVLHHGGGKTVEFSGWGDDELSATQHLQKRLIHQITVYREMLDAVNEKLGKVKE